MVFLEFNSCAFALRFQVHIGDFSFKKQDAAIFRGIPMKLEVVVLGIIVLVVGVGFASITTGMRPLLTGSFEVSPFEVSSTSVYLETDDRVEGSFTVEGGDNYLRFYVKNTNGEIIYDTDIVRHGRDFSFTATSTGVYEMYFDNGFSIEDKYVTLSTQKSVKIAYGISRETMIIGVGVVCLIMILAGVVLKSKSEADEYFKRLRTFKNPLMELYFTEN
ncbi:MAG: emp24/gp25L/p24 family protein [Candidatus Bathyarchaeota archaeon]